MSRIEYVESPVWVKGEQREWSPTAKIILGVILSLLVLSPAILGVHWEMLLPR